ncbi:hypothetical protein ABW11_07520 [Pluralibacter gergoviae]|uniref:hypothetical protein n=1 Tax=Pluralibacter gergoviae TaxID=61647 RepID=UPI0006519A72|nr:hypothetical protein [Pluralibacter gergoviae]KMK28647.1 hypothetical protein ABW11_07520 [Pluralibacter gergoviae]
MTTILVKDALRAAIEASSGGRQTVMYTSKKQPTFVNIIPKANIQDLNPALGISGVHPAFKQGDKEIPYLYVGTYQGCLLNGEVLSLPNVDANTCNERSTTLLPLLKAMGSTWHAMTSVEWALMQAIGVKNSYNPLGADPFGKSARDSTQAGRRIDGKQPGDTSSQAPRIYTGSGPLSYRHDRKYSGISDLVGNMWERTYGTRVVGGEIQVYGAGNEAALADVSAFGSNAEDADGWYAIHAVTGALIKPTWTGSTRTGDYTPTTPMSVRAVAKTEGLAANEFYQRSWENTAIQPTNTLPDAVKNILELYGVWPTRTANKLLSPWSTVSYNVAAKICMHPARSKDCLFQFGYAGNTESVNTDMGIRPVYYAPLA